MAARPGGRSRRRCCRTPATRGRWRARRRTASADARSGGRSAPRRLRGRAGWPGRARARRRPGRKSPRPCPGAVPTMRRPGIAARRVVAYASSACSRASMSSMPMRLQVVDRRAQADEAGDVRRAGLELVRRVVEDGAVEAHFADHLAAADERRHRLQVLAPRPQRAGAGRAEHLVAGEGVEIAAERRRRRPRGAARACEPSTSGDDAAPARLAADRRAPG